MAQSQQPFGHRSANNPVIHEVSKTDQVMATIKKLSNMSIMVGIPSDKETGKLNERGQEPEPNKRQPVAGAASPIDNSTLGYIHEFGAPSVNIPPRPWLKPGVSESRGQWETYMEQAGRAAFKGDEPLMMKCLHAAGIKAVSGIKNRITAGLKPDLAPRTVQMRLARHAAQAAAVGASGAADMTPLVDTAQMLNSISYVIRKDANTRR